MQSPVRLYLAACADVTRDVVRSTAGRVCVHGHLEIGCVFIGRASGGKHAGNAHPRSGDGPVRRNPRLGRNRTHDGAARRGKIRVQPPSAAGLVQAAMFSPGTLPNRVLVGGGTVERNEAYVITHPVCDAERQSGTCLNVPPRSFPRGTAKVVPSRMAETMREATG